MDEATRRKGAIVVSVAGAAHVSGFYNLATLHPTLPMVIAAALVYVAVLLSRNEL